MSARPNNRRALRPSKYFCRAVGKANGTPSGAMATTGSGRLLNMWKPKAVLCRNGGVAHAATVFQLRVIEIGQAVWRHDRARHRPMVLTVLRNSADPRRPLGIPAHMFARDGDARIVPHNGPSSPHNGPG